MKQEKKDIVAILKEAFRKGEMPIEFLDEDIEWLLAHSESIHPSRDLTEELEKILVKVINERKRRERSREIPVGGASVVMEPGTLNRKELSVGEAMHLVLRANGWNEQGAAERLGVSADTIRTLVRETATLTPARLGDIAESLARKHALSSRTREVLIEWLLNGLRFWELQGKSSAGPMRAAARKKKNK